MSSRCLLTIKSLVSYRPLASHALLASKCKASVLRGTEPVCTGSRGIVTQLVKTPEDVKSDESLCYSPDRTNADRLLLLLAQTKSGVKSSSTPSLKTIRTWYYSTARGELEGAHYSDLIRLIGCDSYTPVFDSPENLEADTPFNNFPLGLDPDYASRWAFATEIAADKESAGYHLDQTDHYWLMRSALERTIEQEGHSKEELKQFIARARRHYRLAVAHGANWTAHNHFLGCLLNLNGLAYADEIIAIISVIFKERGCLHPRLASFTWNIIALYGHEVSEESKKMLVQALIERFHSVPNKILTPTWQKSSQVDDFTTASQPDFSAVGARDIFVDILIPSSSGQPRVSHLLDIYPWALWQIQTAFRSFKGAEDEYPFDTDAAWNSLQIIASSFYPKASHPLVQSRGKSIPNSESRAVELTLICTLAAVERSVSSGYESEWLATSKGVLKDDIKEALLFLSMLWEKEAKNLPRTASLICCVIISFMRLSIYSEDRQLMVAIQRYLTDALVYPVIHDNLTCTKEALQAIAAQSSLTSIALGVQSWPDLSESLEYAHLFPEDVDIKQWMSLVANDVLVQLVTYDPSVAFELYRATKGDGIILSDRTIFFIGKTFLTKGHVDSAFTCLEDLSQESSMKRLLLRTILQAFIQPGYHMNIYAVRQLGDALRANAGILQVEDRDLLERLLSRFLFSNFRKEGIDLLVYVRNRHSWVLNEGFISTQFEKLCTQRRYRTAAQLLMKLQKSSREVSSTTGNIIRYVTLVEGKNLSEETIVRTLPLVFRNRALLDMALEETGLDNFDNWKTWSLRLMSVVAKNPTKYDKIFFSRLVTFLASIGRLKAARKVVDLHMPSLPTAIGNILLSATLRHKSSGQGIRQVDYILHIVSYLMKNNQFEPDHVTLNIIFKCILRWPSVSDKEMLRSLFNQLVSYGYPFPTHGIVPLKYLPFEPVVKQENELYPILLDVLKKLPKDLSFSRHVRPLYRMFITAFRNRGDDEACIKVSKILDNLDKESSLR